MKGSERAARHDHSYRHPRPHPARNVAPGPCSGEQSRAPRQSRQAVDSPKRYGPERDPPTPDELNDDVAELHRRPARCFVVGRTSQDFELVFTGIVRSTVPGPFASWLLVLPQFARATGGRPSGIRSGPPARARADCGATVRSTSDRASASSCPTSGGGAGGGGDRHQCGASTMALPTASLLHWGERC